MLFFQYQEGSGKITAIYCYRKPHVYCHFLYAAFMTSENRMYVNKLPFIIYIRCWSPLSSFFLRKFNNAFDAFFFLTLKPEHVLYLLYLTFK